MPCNWLCKLPFYTVYCTVYRVKFEIVSVIESSIGSLLEIVLYGT
jgi:hypothetical protein